MLADANPQSSEDDDSVFLAELNSVVVEEDDDSVILTELDGTARLLDELDDISFS